METKNYHMLFPRRRFHHVSVWFRLAIPNIDETISKKFQNCVHFFDLSNSKSGPTLRCFMHFYLEARFAPQRRALLRHLNFQKRSGAELLAHFDLQCASRDNTVHFLNTSTSKCDLNPSVFDTSYFHMYFAPQWHAIYRLSSGQLAPHPQL